MKYPLKTSSCNGFFVDQIMAKGMHCRAYSKHKRLEVGVEDFMKQCIIKKEVMAPCSKVITKSGIQDIIKKASMIKCIALCFIKHLVIGS